MLFSLATEPTNIISLIGCLLILGPRVNHFLFSVKSRKSEYWSLQAAKCDIITYFLGLFYPRKASLKYPHVISLTFSPAPSRNLKRKEA